MAKHDTTTIDEQKTAAYGPQPVSRTVSAVNSVAEIASRFSKPAGGTSRHMASTVARVYTNQSRKIREDKLILEYLPMVHRIISQVISYLQPPMSREDLVSAGTIGLIKAARDYDSTKRAEFKTYAYIRVRGAIIDELRGWSFAPPSLKKQFDKAQQILHHVVGQTGNVPDDALMAKELGMTVEKMYRMFENARARHFLSIHGEGEDSPTLGRSLSSAGTEAPSDRIEQTELLSQLTEAIERLPEKQRKIIILYYTRELTMKSIAELLNITESRVSQLHASAIFKLSCRLKQYDEGKK
jgi:RNA polymerase sigma factor for flagellar operon FliA